MRQAVSHLVALGHRRIAYVAGPRTSWANRERVRSLRGVTRSSAFSRSSASAGIGRPMNEGAFPGIGRPTNEGTSPRIGRPTSEGVSVDVGVSTTGGARDEVAEIELIEMGSVMPQFEGGVAAADRILATRATAVIAYNDLVALGLLHRFAARGIAVPEDISVLGFDDIPLGAMVHPALTTVALPKGPAGRAAVDLLLTPQMVNQQLPTQLIVRASTGPAGG
ncbi:substrate-binding domain-containing protein [Actinoplanes sp. LDG1-06]|uniref:Substrate-binding domain-containing protein n=2 Tax=Paractinoplanes ovalisporus TaxID=2810368 RepID=A0ABS2ASD3_9ACTN|nr:substrate-binding domain-containing protein [Actinoplanes ovalisporus]